MKHYSTIKLRIEYTTNNGTSWLLIADSVNADDEVYGWSIPNTPSNQCRVKITSLESPSTYDQSDTLFTIGVTGKINIPLMVSNKTGETGVVYFGLDTIATDGIDKLLGEESLPPVPPSDIFDVRFIIPNNDATQKDYRYIAQDRVNWTVKFQTGANEYPILLRWDKNNLPEGTLKIKDLIDGNQININMKDRDSLFIYTASIVGLKIEYSKQICGEIKLLSGWNIVSVPLMADNMGSGTLFPDATSLLYGYNNGYQTTTTLVTGKGYWVRYSTADTIELCGMENTSGSIPVKAGWNLIGPYNESQVVNQITTTPANILTSLFYGYNGGYQIPTLLQVSKGYWIRAGQDGVINLGGSLLKRENIVQFPKINETWDKIRIKDSQNREVVLYIGGEEDNKGNYDLPPVPPEGVFDVRFASDRLVEDVSTRQEIVVNSAEYPVEVEVSRMLKEANTSNSEDAVKTKIKVKVERGNERTEKTLKDGERILIGEGSRIYIETVEIPKEFGLSQNYPNPFNPSTIISYQLPVDSKVTLKLYDILGREVALLVDEIKEAGNHNYQLSIVNYKLSSGVYLYEMRAGDFRSVKKMVLVK